MREFKGKTGVITGAASGIGRALALRCAEEGMHAVAADMEPAALDRIGEELDGDRNRPAELENDPEELD